MNPEDTTILPSGTFHLYQRNGQWWIKIKLFPKSNGLRTWFPQAENRPCTAQELERFSLKNEATEDT